MVNKDQISKIVKKRAKRTFSSVDKQRFYLLWKESGLKKSQFCKNHDLVLSAFTKWCRKISLDKHLQSSENDWVPIVSNNSIPESIKDNPAIIKIEVPIAIKICIFLLFPILILREVLNAVNVIW